MESQGFSGEIPGKVISAAIQKESRGNDWAIGDKKYRNGRPRPQSEWAYGPLQIRRKCVEDVNKHFGTHFKARDCLGNRLLSVWIFQRYMEIHATRKALRHNPTPEDYFGIWNGGPNGWRGRFTRSYIADAMRRLRRMI